MSEISKPKSEYVLSIQPEENISKLNTSKVGLWAI